MLAIIYAMTEGTLYQSISKNKNRSMGPAIVFL